MQSLSPVDYNKYLKTGELERHGKPMLGADGQPLFSDEKVAEMVALLSGADKEARSKVVQMIYADKRIQDLDGWAKAAAVAGFFALQGLAPTEAQAGTTLNSSTFAMEKTVGATKTFNKSEFFLGNPVTLSLSPDQYQKKVGEGNLAGSTTTPYYHQTTLKSLGIKQSASIDLEKINGKPVPLSTYTMAYANTQDKDGNYWAYDGFRDGQAWLVKLSYEELSRLSFVEYNGALYLEKVKSEKTGKDDEACGNIWIPVVVNDGEADDNGQLDRGHKNDFQIPEKPNVDFERGEFVTKIKFNRGENKFFFKNEFGDIYRAKYWHIEWFDDGSVEGWVRSTDGNRYIVDIPADAILAQRIADKGFTKTLSDWSYVE